MKKLYLIFLALLILFIPTTRAAAVYQLDQPVSELNGFTLREVFENRNMAMPDLTSATDLGGGNYRIYNSNGIIVDYNIFNGIYTRSGIATFPSYIRLTKNIIGYNNEIMTMKITRVNGSGQVYPFITTGSNYGANMTENLNQAIITKVLNNPNNNSIEIYNNIGVSYTVQFKLQLEKGSQASPYQLPTNGPYSDIDLGQFGLTDTQIERYYNLYLEAVRFEIENEEAGKDAGDYQNIFKSIINGVKGLINSMGQLWTWLNAPLITTEMQDFNFINQLTKIDFSWDLIGVIRQVLDVSAGLVLRVLLIVPTLVFNLMGISVRISILSLVFSNIVFVILGWIMVKSFII